jgi:hypothetical protein
VVCIGSEQNLICRLKKKHLIFLHNAAWLFHKLLDCEVWHLKSTFSYNAILQTPLFLPKLLQVVQGPCAKAFTFLCPNLDLWQGCMPDVSGLFPRASNIQDSIDVPFSTPPPQALHSLLIFLSSFLALCLVSQDLFATSQKDLLWWRPSPHLNSTQI